MPKLHVIYDKEGALQNSLPPKKFKVAIIDIAEGVPPEDFTKLASHLAELLLEQFQPYEGEEQPDAI